MKYYEIGALHRGDVRNLLERIKFFYGGIDYFEEKHFLSSIFWIKKISLPAEIELDNLFMSINKGY